jgi:hypothetical protein
MTTDHADEQYEQTYKLTVELPSFPERGGVFCFIPIPPFAAGEVKGRPVWNGLRSGSGILVTDVIPQQPLPFITDSTVVEIQY